MLGQDRVILGLSGGVDSSVAAVLLNRAIGDRLTCIFVDHGMLRKNEFRQVMDDYKVLGLNVIGVDARYSMQRPKRLPMRSGSLRVPSIQTVSRA